MMRKIILQGKTGLLEFNFDNNIVSTFIVNTVTSGFDSSLTVDKVLSIKGYKPLYDSDVDSVDVLYSLRWSDE